MSLAEAQRFCQDLASNKQLNEKVKPAATGLASMVAAARSHGYSFTLDELKQAVRSRANRELSDSHLEALAGGAAPPGAQPAFALVNTMDNQVVAAAVQTNASTLVQGVVVLI